MNIIWFILFIYQIKNLKNEIFRDLLLITNENKLHYVYIKDFSRFMCNKTRCKIKKNFCKYYLQCFSSERLLAEHKETCSKINGKQTVKLKNGTVKFENHFKQLAVLFRIYADFECNLKEVRSSIGVIILN